MTELLSQAQLEQVASVAEMASLRPTRPTLVRRWQIDATTGRPVSHWGIEPQRPEDAP